MFKLFYINKVHEHPLKKEENRIVESYIRELPETMPISSMMAMTKKNFSISRSKFYYLHRRVWNEKFSFKEMVATLDEKRYESRFNPFPLEEKQIPNLFITASPKMIKNFKVKIKLHRNLDSLSPSMSPTIWSKNSERSKEKLKNGDWGCFWERTITIKQFLLLFA